MHKARVKKKYNLSAEKIWKAFDDFGGIHKFHPLVKASPTINEQDSGKGCERVCEFYKGGAIKERIVDYKKGESMKIDVYEAGPFPLKKGIADISVKSLGANKSEATFEFSFTPKYGPVGWLMGKLIMKSQFEKILGQVLNGIETHYQTGKFIGEKGVLVESPAV